jgi:hypothetical protein
MIQFSVFPDIGIFYNFENKNERKRGNRNKTIKYTIVILGN